MVGVDEGDKVKEVGRVSKVEGMGIITLMKAGDWRG